MFTNTLNHEDVGDFFMLWKAGVLDCFIPLLETSTDTLSLILSLEAIYYMLKIGRKIAAENQSDENMVLVELEKFGALDKFDELQDHQDMEVQATVMRIIKEFMPFIELRLIEEEFEDEEKFK